MSIDLNMLAYDLASMLDRYQYADVSSDDVRPHLPAFMAAIQGEAAGMPDRPDVYDFEDTDENTLAWLGGLADARAALVAANLPAAVAALDAYAADRMAEEIAEAGEEEGE